MNYSVDSEGNLIEDPTIVGNDQPAAPTQTTESQYNIPTDSVQAPTSEADLYTMLGQIYQDTAGGSGDFISAVFGTGHEPGKGSNYADNSTTPSAPSKGHEPGEGRNYADTVRTPDPQKSWGERFIDSASKGLTKSLEEKPEGWIKGVLDAIGGAYKEDQIKKAADLKYRQEQELRDTHNNAVVASRLNTPRGLINGALKRNTAATSLNAPTVQA